MNSNKIDLQTILKTALYVATLGGVGYFAVMVFLHIIGQSMTGMVDWVYRIAIILVVIWSIFALRFKSGGRGLAFFPAFGTGLLASAFLGCYMALTALIFFNYVAPDYNEKFEAYYRAKRSEQMYNTRLKTMREKNDNMSYTLTAEDTAVVEKGLGLHMQGSKYYFTASGAAAVNLIFSLIWGIAVSTSVAFMARKQS